MKKAAVTILLYEAFANVYNEYIRRENNGYLQSEYAKYDNDKSFVPKKTLPTLTQVFSILTMKKPS